MKSLTLADKILVLAIAGLVVLAFLGRNIYATQGSLVIVELNGLAVYKGNLDEDRKVTIRGEHGDVRIQIRDKKVGVPYAECPNQVCVRMGWRSGAGETIVCVPNKVVVRIEGEKSVRVRGVTG